MIYSPREDSFLLEKVVRKCARGRVLDLGAGSGVLGAAALESGAEKVLFADIDSEVVKILLEKGFDAVQSDLFSNVKGKFDMIIFNPPYLPFDEREDAESALATSGGKNGDEILIRFFKDAGKFLRANGVILIMISSLTPRGRVLPLLNKWKWKVAASEKFFMETLGVWEIRKA